MAVDLNIKTNSKQVQRKFKRFQSVLPRVIDKGLKQAGFQLLDIIRTKTQKGIDFRGFKPEQDVVKEVNEVVTENVVPLKKKRKTRKKKDEQVDN